MEESPMNIHTIEAAQRLIDAAKIAKTKLDDFFAEFPYAELPNDDDDMLELSSAIKNMEMELG